MSRDLLALADEQAAQLRELADEQAALRRVAQLSARSGGPGTVFAAVAREASELLGGGLTALTLIEDSTVGVVVASSDDAVPTGTRYPVERGTVMVQVLQTGEPARVDDYSGLPSGKRAAALGVRASVGVPVRVDDRLWGVLITGSSGPLPPDAERRLLQFAEIVAATVSAAQTRRDLAQIADEQAALRRVAELVARAAPPAEVFSAVAREASGLLDGRAMTLTRFDGGTELVVVASQGGPAPLGERIALEPDTLPDRVLRGAPVVRVDDYMRERDAELAASFSIVAAVTVAVAVAGEVWGMLTATSDAGPLPPDTEQRLEEFAQLVGAAVSNSQARTDLQSKVDEQAALRQVAELAARGASAEDVLQAVAVQGSRLAGVDFTSLLRYEPDGSTEIVALNGAPDGVAVGMRAPGTGDGAVQRVWRTGRAARVDDLSRASGRWPTIAPGSGFSASLAVPVLIDGAQWGVLVVVGRRPLPRGTEDHLANFADLIGTAIAAAEARLRLRALADEQAALRRVAELVARGPAPEEVFLAVTNEASALLGELPVTLVIDDDGVVSGGRHSPAADGSTAAVPITVEGRVRAALVTSSSGRPLPADTESRLGQFAELAAVAIANAETKAKLTASRARVVATADETRRRLQRDVHDGAQQRLVHTIIALRLARAALTAGSGGADLIDEALTNAERANRELRDVVHGILPASLTRGGCGPGWSRWSPTSRSRSTCRSWPRACPRVLRRPRTSSSPRP